MKVRELELSVPEGYTLCPYPKQWLREHSGFQSVGYWLKADLVTNPPTIDTVLTFLGSLSDLQEWMTVYSSVKGVTKFCVGLRNDAFAIGDIHHYSDGEKAHVYFQWSDVRLYAQLPKKNFSSR